MVVAGEEIGFLPGDIKDKTDPYLQPIYDALETVYPSQGRLSQKANGS